MNIRKIAATAFSVAMLSTLAGNAHAAEIKDKTVRFDYRVTRDGELLLTGHEMRIMTRPHPDDPKRLQVIPIPEDLRKKLEGNQNDI